MNIKTNPPDDYSKAVVYVFSVGHLFFRHMVIELKEGVKVLDRFYLDVIMSNPHNKEKGNLMIMVMILTQNIEIAMKQDFLFR